MSSRICNIYQNVLTTERRWSISALLRVRWSKYPNNQSHYWA